MRPPTKGHIVHITSKTLKEKALHYSPAIITTISVAITVATIYHYHGKVLLNVSENVADIMKETGDNVLYETPYGDMLLRMAVQK